MDLHRRGLHRFKLMDLVSRQSSTCEKPLTICDRWAHHGVSSHFSASLSSDAALVFLCGDDSEESRCASSDAPANQRVRLRTTGCACESSDAITHSDPPLIIERCCRDSHEQLRVLQWWPHSVVDSSQSCTRSCTHSYAHSAANMDVIFMIDNALAYDQYCGR